MPAKRYTAEDLENRRVVSNKLSEAEEKVIWDAMMRSKIQVILRFPFFGSLALHLTYKMDYTTPTAATDGNTFYFNPRFMKAHSESERSWIIVHEIMHAALKHIWRRGNRDQKKWNYACDYAIHSIMQQYVKYAADQAMNRASKGDPRQVLTMPKNCLYDEKYDNLAAEQIYDLLPKDYDKKNNNGDNGNGQGNSPFDDHSRWDSNEAQKDRQRKEREWDGRIVTAAEIDANKNAGNIPGFLKRLVNKITKPQKNWRALLAEFVETITDDYSWCPPDNRFDENDFDGIMMPGFNDTSEMVKDIVFEIDTSGSIGDKELQVAYSELVGAIDQFRGKLTGKVGFFDHEAYGLHDFEDVDDILKLKPEGGGGTSFEAPMEKTLEAAKNSEIAGLIILTDGYAPWPDKNMMKDIPVLWIINNEDVTPPWGIVARIEVNND